MTFPEVTERVFMNGPKCTQSIAMCVKHFVSVGLFLTYFGTCSVYTVIIARNCQQVLENYTGELYNVRIFIACFLIPLIVLTFIPDLKKLAPISMVANIFIAIGILITSVYMVRELPSIEDRDYFKFDNLPNFFAITIFALEAIGMIMPLENSMKTPTHFLGICGVLYLGMLILASLSIMLGFLGYWRYGPDTSESITLNLPSHEWPAQVVKMLIAIAMYCTFALQFTVCLEITWNAIKDHFTNNPIFANYVLRVIFVLGVVAVAIAVPTIAPFVGLIGAVFFSTLGLMLPVILETILCLEMGFGIGLWILWKNIFIVLFGLFALFFGTYDALKEISKIY